MQKDNATNSTKVKKTQIFSNENTELRDTANRITNIMTKLIENTT